MDDFGAAYNKPAPEILCAGYLSLSLQASSCCWAFHRCAYSPRRDSSSSWVPCSEMTPCHKHTNLIGVSHIGQPVGDQKDGFISGEPFDLSHNGIFAFYVNVGGGLIEDMDGGAVEQYTGNRQTLALSTEKIGEVLFQFCVQSW